MPLGVIASASGARRSLWKLQQLFLEVFLKEVSFVNTKQMLKVFVATEREPGAITARWAMK